MQEKVCCVLNPDEYYSVKLAAAFNNNGKLPYNTLAYSSEAALLEAREKYRIEILLVDEEVDSEIIEKVKPNFFFILTDDKTDADNNTLCKFQSVDKITKEIMVVLTEGGIVHKDKKTQIIAVYSPANKCFKTTISLGLAFQRGKDKKILFISLEEFAAVGGVLGEGGKSLSEALFYFLNEEKNALKKIVSCINSAHGFDFFLPVDCPEDVADLKPQELLKFLDAITEMNIYEEIIIDIGNLIGKPWEILNNCQQIIIPKSLDYVGREKEKKFMNFIEKSHYKNMVQKINSVEIEIDEGLVGQKIGVANINSTSIEKLCKRIG